MTTITANIPVRKIGGCSLAAHTKTFFQDPDGRWIMQDDLLGNVRMCEAEVIDVCSRASNWAAIRAAHFPMNGFHS